MDKKKSGKSKKSISSAKSFYLDKPTSHGGWPGGHSGSYRDPNTPVNKQISKFLSDMGLLDDDNPRARLSEDKIRVKRIVLEGLLSKILIESNDSQKDEISLELKEIDQDVFNKITKFLENKQSIGQVSGMLILKYQDLIKRMIGAEGLLLVQKVVRKLNSDIFNFLDRNAITRKKLVKGNKLKKFKDLIKDFVKSMEEAYPKILYILNETEDSLDNELEELRKLLSDLLNSIKYFLSAIIKPIVDNTDNQKETSFISGITASDIDTSIRELILKSEDDAFDISKLSNKQFIDCIMGEGTTTVIGQFYEAIVEKYYLRKKYNDIIHTNTTIGFNSKYVDFINPEPKIKFIKPSDIMSPPILEVNNLMIDVKGHTRGGSNTAAKKYLVKSDMAKSAIIDLVKYVYEGEDKEEIITSINSDNVILKINNVFIYVVNLLVAKRKSLQLSPENIPVLDNYDLHFKVKSQTLKDLTFDYLNQEVNFTGTGDNNFTFTEDVIQIPIKNFSKQRKLMALTSALKTGSGYKGLQGRKRTDIKTILDAGDLELDVALGDVKKFNFSFKFEDVLVEPGQLYTIGSVIKNFFLKKEETKKLFTDLPNLIQPFLYFKEDKGFLFKAYLRKFLKNITSENQEQTLNQEQSIIILKELIEEIRTKDIEQFVKDNITSSKEYESNRAKMDPDDYLRNEKLAIYILELERQDILKALKEILGIIGSEFVSTILKETNQKIINITSYLCELLIAFILTASSLKLKKEYYDFIEMPFEEKSQLTLLPEPEEHEQDKDEILGLTTQDNNETDDLPNVEDDEEDLQVAESKLYRMVLKDLFEHLNR